jgi:hypothetical protein
LKRLEASIEAPTNNDAKVAELLSEIRQIRIESDTGIAPVAPTTEWVFDIERGPYNEIKQVNARRASKVH